MESIGKKIKKLRADKGYSQDSIYTLSKKGNSQVSQIENGKIPNPTQPVLQNIAENLEISPAINLMFLPNLGPSVLKFGFICLIKTAESSPKNSISFTFISLLIIEATPSISSFILRFRIGVIIFCSG